MGAALLVGFIAGVGGYAVMWNVHGPQPVSEIRPDLTAEQKQEIDFDALTQIGRGDLH